VATPHDTTPSRCSRAVRDAVWALHAHALTLTGPLPTLIEWDSRVPDWPALVAEDGTRPSRTVVPVDHRATLLLNERLGEFARRSTRVE